MILLCGLRSWGQTSDLPKVTPVISAQLGFMMRSRLEPTGWWGADWLNPRDHEWHIGLGPLTHWRWLCYPFRFVATVYWVPTKEHMLICILASLGLIFFMTLQNWHHYTCSRTKPTETPRSSVSGPEVMGWARDESSSSISIKSIEFLAHVLHWSGQLRANVLESSSKRAESPVLHLEVLGLETQPIHPLTWGLWGGKVLCLVLSESRWAIVKWCLELIFRLTFLARSSSLSPQPRHVECLICGDAFLICSIH